MPDEIPPSPAPETTDARRSALLTVGHGTHPAEEFLGLLHGAGVAALVDVRIGPGSRRNPQFGRDELARRLPAAGVDYRWDRRLGGFRKLPVDSPDTALRNESFRAYAGYMRTVDFAAAVDELLDAARNTRTVIMCSESVWWRCHRRMIADYAQLLRAVPVLHLMPDGRLTPHPPTSGVRVAGRELVYDVAPPDPT